NKHGKHRHAFQRHSTPPGFWRVDMPTTQETAEDRAKASQMVRNKVEERWREAHRPGGR
ncbi:DNA repair protein Sae2, partial [Teratosphaeria nubilosa]